MADEKTLDATKKDEPAKVNQPLANSKEAKGPDHTVKGGIYARPKQDGFYEVVDAEGEVIPGKSVVRTEKGTIEIVDK